MKLFTWRYNNGSNQYLIYHNDTLFAALSEESFEIFQSIKGVILLRPKAIK